MARTKMQKNSPESLSNQISGERRINAFCFQPIVTTSPSQNQWLSKTLKANNLKGLFQMETPSNFQDNKGNLLNQKPSEVEQATKLVVEALGGFHWRCDYVKFCEVLDFEPSDYAEQKYSEFQELISNLNKFDLQCLTKIVQEGHLVGNG